MQFKESEYLDLRELLIDRYTDRYATHDKAHRIDHVVSVCDLALEMNERMVLGLDRRLIVVPALLHDLFTWSRSNHEQLAYYNILTNQDSWIQGFSDDERRSMALACLEHRASYKGTYSSLLSELIASADRGAPDSVERAIARSYGYATTKLGMSETEARVHSVEHVKEKFGKGGYAKYPELYLRYFGERLVDFQEAISRL